MSINLINANIPTGHHKRALEWFMQNAGQEVRWKNRIEDETYIFTTAKGIYKPKDSEYALSVRQTLGGVYPDHEPVYRSDGTWTYRYHQENQSGKNPTELFTNKGLLACMRDNVPIGVARQTKPKPETSYQILGIAKVSEYKDGFFQLDGYSPKGSLFTQPIDGPFSDLIQETKTNEIIETFNPSSQNDERAKVIREITQRRGQGRFRNLLMRIYGGKCAVTKCKVSPVLEAAHITPYLGPETNQAGNGILLRADIHTLWDLGLVAINPENYQFWVSPGLAGSEYEKLSGIAVFQPGQIRDRPSYDALKAQWEAVAIAFG